LEEVMGTWGAGLFASDSAQDFLEEMRAASIEDRLGRVAKILERTAADPSTIMREYVPEEIIVAAAVVAATMPSARSAGWMSDAALQDAIAGIPSQTQIAALASSALQAAVDFNDSWLISSLKDEGDRQSLLRELNELKTALEVEN
jgi:Domain of unknown function (DUF4259)